MLSRVIRRSATHVMRRIFLALTVMAASMTATGCATTGATLGSGVGDAFLERAPWVAGKPLPPERGPLLVLPVAWQPSVTQPAFMDPSSAGGSPLAQLVDSLQRDLVRANLGKAANTFVGSHVIPPDVSFGCALVLDECDPQYAGEPRGRRGLRYRLAVGRPSAEWRAELQRQLDATGATHALFVSVEIAPWQVQQRGLRGTKVVPLGVGHEAELPWLTSLETPVAVLQLTGVVVDREGKAVRIAAAGMLPKRTPLLLSAVGAEALLQDADIASLLCATRDDVDGRPAVWRDALREVLQQLGLR
ncbi:MAG: hypothetical protein IBJ03_18970 [Gemmatimonadaceae bacterium]|nr:hypothetical protein [Gemmatimonadaceae bacterium]